MRYVGEELLNLLQREFKSAITDVTRFRGEVCVTVDKSAIKDFLRFLKLDDNFKMDMLVDLTAVDYPEHTPRVVVVYQLRSLEKGHNLRVKCWAENDELPTVLDLWRAADWLEREVYEMFGVRFKGRELKKLLLPQKYPYFPLRKDFPLEGYEEPCQVWDWE